MDTYRYPALTGAKGQRGTAMVAMLLIFGALSVLSVGLMVFSTTEVRIADNQRDHTAALYAAEAGVSEVLGRMDLDPGATVTVNGGTFDPYIGDDPLNPDPAWRTEVHLSSPGGLPAPTGTEIVAATIQPSGGWLEYGDTGQGLAPISIEHKWTDLDADGVRDLGELILHDGRRFPPENYATGMPIDVITVPAILNGSRRSVISEVTRMPINIGVAAAISSDNGVDLTGNMTACGHNHDIATPAGAKIPACWGFELCSNRTLDAAAGCLVGVMTTGDDANAGGSSDLEGFPAWSDTSSANVFYDVEQYLGLSLTQWNQIRGSPDYTSSNDAVNMDGIVIVDGDAVGSETFNGNVGTGLIYVNGDMDISGNFEWRGMIYVEGNCDITGTAWILGAIVVRGTTTAGAFSAGNSTVLYSEDAIYSYVNSNLPFIQLGWKEI